MSILTISTQIEISLLSSNILPSLRVAVLCWILCMQSLTQKDVLQNTAGIVKCLNIKTSFTCCQFSIGHSTQTSSPLFYIMARVRILMLNNRSVKKNSFVFIIAITNSYSLVTKVSGNIERFDPERNSPKYSCNHMKWSTLGNLAGNIKFGN